MKIRNELNKLLYQAKMDESPVPKRIWDTKDYASICSGNTHIVKKEFRNGTLSFVLGEKKLSRSASKDAAIHFALTAITIAEACINSGLGNTESYAIAELYIHKADSYKKEDDICALFCDMCLDYAERMTEIRKESSISLPIRKCIDYIHENLGKNPSIVELAKVVGLNPTYLSRLFLKEVGIPLKRFIKEARIDTAKNLLSYSNLSYLSISNSLGFSSQSAFIVIFKDITGVTPKEYRTSNYHI